MSEVEHPFILLDSTAEYISGTQQLDGICSSGLKCVTVLLGVYDRFSGVPLIGVINQPFFEFADGEYVGQFSRVF